MGSTLKERICSFWSTFFPFRVDLIYEMALLFREADESHRNCLSLKMMMVKKHVSIDVHLSLILGINRG